MLQLILAPSKGWEDIAATTYEPEEVVKRLMYPMMTVAALTAFIQMIYDIEPHFANTLIAAMVIFVSLFITYFFGRMMFGTFLYKFCSQEPSMRKITTVLSYCMSLMALATIICNVLPVKLGLTYLLPLGVALILWKANVYFAVREDRDFFYIIFGVFTVIVPPILIQQVFESIIN